MSESSRGRPPASSREVLADAACELFFEQGYEATTAAEIARRAGVSRSSFFNYFATKHEILWFGFDEQLERLCADLADPGVEVLDALENFGRGLEPDTLALAIAEAATMGVEDELFEGRAVRQLRIASEIRDRLLRDGVEAVRAEVVAAGYAGVLVSSVWKWAAGGAGRHPLLDTLTASLTRARELLA